LENTINPNQAVSYSSKKEYDKAVELALKQAQAYYETDSLLTDDASYDMLVAKIAATEKAHPSWKENDLQEVAGGVSTGGSVEHKEPMLSLDKAHSFEDIDLFFQKFEKLFPEETISFSVEAKLDGIALSAHYKDKSLQRVITRGDGRFGEDVTVQVATGKVKGLPLTVDTDQEFEVRGECYLDQDQFELANKNRIEKDQKPAFVNRRNAVAGTIRTKELTRPTEMSFSTYSVHGQLLDSETSYLTQMKKLKSFGFSPTVDITGNKSYTKPEQLKKALEELGKRRPSLDFEIDGAVIKADNLKVRQRAGSTSAYPRWAIAFKYQAEERSTKVLDIDMTPGRTGVLVPRAILEPVFVGGATISFATLHNPNELLRLDVRVGDTVMVKRAGDVIPKIEGVLLDKRPKNSTKWQAPTSCPRCGSALDKSQKRWRCIRGRLCGAAELIVYAASRDALDIEGLGQVLVQKLVDQNLVKDLGDIFSLSQTTLANLDRMGELSASNLIKQIDDAKTKPLSRWITALGLSMTGRRVSRKLAEEFKTFDGFCTASQEDLAKIDGVGPIKARSIKAELEQINDLIQKLKKAGVEPEPSIITKPNNGPWSGKTVVITGSIQGLSRTQASEAAESLGAKVSGSVSTKTDIVVAGENAGSKVAKAQSLNVEILSAQDFLNLL